MTDEQYANIMSRAEFEIEDAKAELEKRAPKPGKGGKPEESDGRPEQGAPVMEEGLKQFSLDTYGDSSAGEADDAMEEDFIQAMSNVDAAALGEDDDYLPGGDNEGEEEEEEEDRDDLTIRPTDTLLVATRTEDDISYLEVYVYEEADDNLYVHHDVMLPAFPLCVEWIGAGGLGSGSRTTIAGNCAAVGTFEPEIEIWNLDILETPYPSVILGQRDPKAAAGSKRQGKKKSSGITADACPDRHTDAVMCLSWNRLHSTMLLSGSADATVKLWDVGQAQALRSFDHHRDKVQALQWNPSEPSVLASAAYDKSLKSFDCRMPGTICHWALPADPECLRWNPHQPSLLTVSDEEGRVMAFDTRRGAGSEPLFLLQAHGKAVTSIDWNPAVPDCLLTVSADKAIKLWNVAGGGAEISCVVTRELGVGKAFTGSFSPDAPNLVCVAGSKGVLSVVNMLNDQAVVQGFAKQGDQSQR